MSYDKDRRWSDDYIPAIKRIVGPRILEVSPFEVDTKQAADLIVMRSGIVTVAARVRRHGYAELYPDDFTIRSRRDSGVKTELAKIVDGFGTLMFYGHASRDEPGEFSRWMIVDLNAFRAHLIRGHNAWEEKSNGDGTHFCVFDVKTFVGDPPILIDRG